MKLVSWNVNGIRAAYKKGGLDDVMRLEPDVLCIQETKANEDQSPFHPDGYHQIWHDGQRKGYSGTAIFTKEEPLSTRRGFSKAIQDKYVFKDNFGDTTLEGRLITIELPEFYIVTSYTPNSKRALERLDHRHKNWDPAFREYLDELRSHKPVLACGDLNVAHTEIDLARPKDNRKNAGFTDEEREGIQNLIDSGYLDTFRELHPDAEDCYTWWSAWGNARDRNVGWRIDYWLADPDMMPRVVEAQIHADIFGSDHCPVSIEIN